MDDKNARPADETAGADEADDSAAIWQELAAEEQEAAAAPAITGRAATELDGAISQRDIAALDETSKEDDTAAADDKDKAAGGETKTKDIWATATPEQKAAYDAAQARMTALEQSDASQRGRVSALTKKIDTLSKPPAKAAKNEVAELMEGKDFKAAETDYPEIMKPVRAVLDKVSAVVTPLAEKVEQTTTTMTAISQERTREELGRQYEAVIEKHADYDQIAKSQAFSDWYRTAPTYIREGVERNAKFVIDGGEVASIVSQFKADTGWKPTKPAADGGDPKPDLSDKRRAQLESSRAPDSRGTVGATNLIPEDEKAAWDYFEAQDIAAAKAAQRR